MRCPYCQVDNDRVIDSRASEDGFAIRRRRDCLNCKRRYTTYERIDEQEIRVVKKNGARDPFNRDKVRQGIAKACWKRRISEEQIDAVIARIENQILSQGDPEIESHELGELVMAELRELDEVAFVRFASVYRDFKNVQDFVEELRPMLKAKE